MTQQTKVPLWKELNEKMTDLTEQIQSLKPATKPWSDVVNKRMKIEEQYSTLAVINLHILAEALDNLIDWCIQFTPEYPAALVKAKEALSNIS